MAEFWDLVWTVLLGAFSAGIWLLWLRSNDVYAVKKGQRHIVPVFFACGLLSAPMAVLLTRLSESAMPIISEASSAAIYYYFITGPVEELSKFLVFLVVAGITRSIRDPMDAAIQGASVGLGFAVIENILFANYYGNEVLWYRSIFTIGGHMTWSSLGAFSYGAVVYWYRREGKRVAWGLVVLAISAAAFLHASYNTLLGFGNAGYLLAILLSIAVISFLVYCLRDSRRLSPYYGYPLRDWRKALDNLAYGIQRDPDNWILHHRRGIYCLCGGLDAEAHREFEEALTRTPDPCPRAMLAVVEHLHGEADACSFLAETFAAMSLERRSLLVGTVKQVLRSVPGGCRTIAAVRDVHSQLSRRRPEPSPLKTIRNPDGSPAWLPAPKAVLGRVGIMNRTTEGLMHTRKLYNRSLVAVTRRNQEAALKRRAESALQAIAQRRAREQKY